VEDAYDRIAEAIDAAGEHHELFLAKLALTLAWRCGDPAALDEAIRIALLDLDAAATRPPGRMPRDQPRASGRQRRALPGHHPPAAVLPRPPLEVAAADVLAPRLSPALVHLARH